MRKTNPKDNALYDGTLEIHEVANIAPPGKYPVEGLKLVYRLPYRERTVGIQRYYTAKEHQSNITHVVRCPRPPDRIVKGVTVEVVSTLEKVVLPTGQQYSIVQVQYPEDIVPRVMDLSLEVMRQRMEVHDVDA